MTARADRAAERRKAKRAPRPPRKGERRNAGALQGLDLDIEQFSEFAWREVEEVRAATYGICALPQCSARFNPRKPGQIYCSDQCRDEDKAEHRTAGRRLAPAILAMRRGKYAEKGTPQHALFLKAWAYIGQLGTVWNTDREKRRREAERRNDG